MKILKLQVSKELLWANNQRINLKKEPVVLTAGFFICITQIENITKRPLQKSIICSNSRPEENLTTQLPVGNEEVKFFDNEEVGHRIGLFGMFF